MSKILVVDDEKGFRTLLRRILEEAGHQVIEATNGDHALDVFRRETPEIVISDIIMPDRDGIEAIAIIKSECPATKVLAISGGGRAHAMDLLAIAPRAGADMTLEKPFRKTDLLSCISQLHELRESEKL
jgi:CheY-like chemotaxis protein